MVPVLLWTLLCGYTIAFLLHWFLMTHNGREAIFRYSLLLESTSEWKKKGEGREFWCQLPFWIIIMGNDLQIFNVVCVTSSWFVPYSDLSETQGMCLGAFCALLGYEVRSCSSWAGSDLPAVLQAPAHKPIAFLCSRHKILCTESCSWHGELFSFPAVLVWRQSWGGCPASLSPSTASARERWKSSAKFEQERRSHRGGAGFSQALAFAGQQ